MFILFGVAHVPIFLAGALDEMDFWAGTFFVVVFALCEVLIFFWGFSPSAAWAEINRGGFIKLPRVFFFIMRYVTPTFLSVITAWWLFKMLPGYLGESRWTAWVAREVLVGIMLLFCFLVYFQDKRRKKR